MALATTLALTAALSSAPFSKMQGTYKIELCKKVATSQNTQNFCNYKKLSIGIGQFGVVFYFFNIHSGTSPHTAMSFPLKPNKKSGQAYQEAGDKMASFAQQNTQPGNRSGYSNSTTLMKRPDGSYVMLYQSDSAAFGKQESFEIYLVKINNKSLPLPNVPEEEEGTIIIEP